MNLDPEEIGERESFLGYTDESGGPKRITTLNHGLKIDHRTENKEFQDSGGSIAYICLGPSYLDFIFNVDNNEGSIPVIDLSISHSILTFGVWECDPITKIVIRNRFTTTGKVFSISASNVSPKISQFKITLLVSDGSEVETQLNATTPEQLSLTAIDLRPDDDYEWGDPDDDVELDWDGSQGELDAQEMRLLQNQEMQQLQKPDELPPVTKPTKGRRLIEDDF